MPSTTAWCLSSVSTRGGNAPDLPGAALLRVFEKHADSKAGGAESVAVAAYCGRASGRSVSLGRCHAARSTIARAGRWEPPVSPKTP